MFPPGSPGRSEMSFQVSPPSLLCQRPESGPPELIIQNDRCASQTPAYRMRGIRVEREIDRTCFVADEQRLAPVGAAIGRFEDPAFLIGAKGMAESGDPDGIRILGCTRILPMKRVSESPRCDQL